MSMPSVKNLPKAIKLEAVLLYRNILKLHINKLNEEMRVFGDYFVKSEFTLNYKQADENQMKIFIAQWKNYREGLEKMKDIQSEIKSTYSEDELKTKMDIDQKKSLDDIKNIIQNKE